jgi:hypothetical protein
MFVCFICILFICVFFIYLIIRLIPYRPLFYPPVRMQSARGGWIGDMASRRSTVVDHDVCSFYDTSHRSTAGSSLGVTSRHFKVQICTHEFYSHFVFSSWLVNLDLPVSCSEHTTLGGVFLDGCEITAEVDTAHVMPNQPETDDAPVRLDVAAALRVPAVGDPPTGSVTTARVRPESGLARYSAVNARLGWRWTAEWDSAAFPWLCLWTEHCKREQPPWNGRERTRGLYGVSYAWLIIFL